MIDGKATVYVCRGFACDAPSTDPAVLAMSALVEDAIADARRRVAPARCSAAAAATCCRSIWSARSARQLHALESERGIKWLTIEGSGGEFSYGARIQEHTPEMMRDGAAGDASHHQAAAGVPGADRGAGRRPMPWRRLRAGAGVRRHHRHRDARRSACPRSGWPRFRRRPRRCCRCASAPRAPRAPSSPARRRTRSTGTTRPAVDGGAADRACSKRRRRGSTRTWRRTRRWRCRTRCAAARLTLRAQAEPALDRAERDYLSGLLKTADAAEGVQAWLEKRAPNVEERSTVNVRR